MEGTPIGIDARALQEDLLLIPGVVEVHDLHVWSLSVGKPSLACHLVVGEFRRTEACRASFHSNVILGHPRRPKILPKQLVS